MKNIARIVTATVLLTIAAFASASDDIPWAFNNGQGDGYSVKLISVSPEPGTPLVSGKSVTFKATVEYTNTVAPTGFVALVFQTEKGPAKPAGATQVKQDVAEKSGTVTLEETLVIPKKAKELRLFIPVSPEGLKETDGEVLIRWPIKKR